MAECVLWVCVPLVAVPMTSPQTRENKTFLFQVLDCGPEHLHLGPEKADLKSTCLSIPSVPIASKFTPQWIKWRPKHVEEEFVAQALQEAALWHIL